jgi:hypothetical protein
MKEFLKKLRNIVEGHKAFILGATPEQEKLAKKRAEVCASCSINVNGFCSSRKALQATRDFIYEGEKRKEGRWYNGCSCPLAQKTLALGSECPLGKWKE